MVTSVEFTRLVLALEGTTSAPHFDRTAFKVARTFATLAADGRSVNLKLMPDEQQLKCLTAPESFLPVPNAWGRQGWTMVDLSTIAMADLAASLRLAWTHALAKRQK